MDEYDYRGELYALENRFSRPDLMLLAIWLGLIAADLIAGLAQPRGLADQAIYLVATLATTAGAVAAFVGAVRVNESLAPVSVEREAYLDDDKLDRIYDIDVYKKRNAA